MAWLMAEFNRKHHGAKKNSRAVGDKEKADESQSRKEHQQGARGGGEQAVSPE
jgi:hypothetical protein